jgi:tRNA pseudouridine55 synthase
MRRGSTRPRVEWRTVDGIVLLDKPVGLSSNHALQQVRRLYRAAKAGHTGSLDPLASGVLPLCFGQATKVAGLLLDADKTYRATLALGNRTATGDREGAVIETRAVPGLTEDAVRAVFARFVGEHSQVPPMYSALKRDGEPLYAIARRGEEVEREPRAVTIFALSLESLEPARLEFSVRCSKGTYVRTLGEDLAVALGTCGHLEALRRTGIGPLGDRPHHTLAELEALAGDEPALDARLLPIDAGLGSLAAIRLGAEESRRIRQGQTVSPGEGLPANGKGATVRLYDAEGAFIGLGTVREADGLIEAKRLMSTADEGA